MAEAVGLAAGLLALASFAFKTSKELHDAVASFKSYWPTIKSLQEELASLVSIVASIEAQVHGSRDSKSLELLEQPLEGCGKTCQSMLEMLQSCAKNSKDGHKSLRDWTKMQYRGTMFDDYKKRLASFKSTLVLELTLVNLQEHSITQDQLEDFQNTMEGTQEETKSLLEDISQTLETVDSSHRQAIEADRDLLQRGLASLLRAQRVVEDTRPTLLVQGNEGGDHSVTLLGTGTDPMAKNVNVTVVDNKAGDGARMAAGMHSEKVLLELLNNAGAQQAARGSQSEQAQSQNTRAMALQSLLNNVSVQQSLGSSNVSPSSNYTDQLSIVGGATASRFARLPPDADDSTDEDAEQVEKIIQQRRA